MLVEIAVASPACYNVNEIHQDDHHGSEGQKRFVQQHSLMLLGAKYTK